MTLITAMQVSRQILDGKELPSYADRNAAIALGYEALRREKDNRDDPDGALCGLLPGETAE